MPANNNNLSGNSSLYPAEGAAAVTPNDAADLPNWGRGIYVGASGNVQLTLGGGDTVTLVGLAAGVVHPLRVRRVWATSTTATGIVVVY